MSVYNPKTNRDEITGLTHDGNWNDVDISAKIGANAVGVMILIWNTDESSSGTYGIRTNGSTDTKTGILSASSSGSSAYYTHTIATGVDSNGVIEINSNNSGLKFFVMGYFDPPAVFFTNKSTFSGASAGAWNDIDITNDVGGDAGDVNSAIVSLVSHTDDKVEKIGVRENGSTHSTFSSEVNTFVSFLVEVDANDVFEVFGDETNYLVGYIPNGDDNYVALGTRVEVDTTVTDTWTEYDVTNDLNSSDAYAVVNLMEFLANNAEVGSLREVSSTNNANETIHPNTHITTIDPADQVIEYYVSNATRDFIIMGSFQDTSAPAVVEERTRRHIFRR